MSQAPHWLALHPTPPSALHERRDINRQAHSHEETREGLGKVFPIGGQEPKAVALVRRRLQHDILRPLYDPFELNHHVVPLELGDVTPIQ